MEVEGKRRSALSEPRHIGLEGSEPGKEPVVLLWPDHLGLLILPPAFSSVVQLR